MNDTRDLHTRIKDDLNDARKNGYTEAANTLTYVLGEFGRLKGTKDGGKEMITAHLTDDQVIRVLKRVSNMEKESARLSGNDPSKEFMRVIELYLPEQVDDNDIINFFKTVDFSILNNKMQAIGLAKKFFGDRADGDKIKGILIKMEF